MHLPVAPGDEYDALDSSEGRTAYHGPGRGGFTFAEHMISDVNPAPGTR
jgi:hypothetical protein